MHEFDDLLLRTLLIFVAAKVVGEVFERLKLPAVLDEIVAGVLIGLYALGCVGPNETKSALAEVGAIFVLFSAGHQLRERTGQLASADAGDSGKCG